jgi:aminodeoxychorismate lyase
MPVLEKTGHLFAENKCNPRNDKLLYLCALRLFALKIRVLIFLNGQIVPAERAVVSIFDRGFLYGDGLFESMRVLNGKPFRWTQHLERLQRGADFLKIKIPYSTETLRKSLDQLVAKNKMPDALLRLTLSRGVGVRGYSPKDAEKPTVAMALHPGPAINGTIPKWKLVISSQRLPANDPLAQYKTCNKLPQILARSEADTTGADEALLLNTDGFVVEGTSSNLFWIKGNKVCSPPLAAGILPGVTRAIVFEICKAVGIAASEENICTEELKQTDAVFLSITSVGIAEAVSLDGAECKQSPLLKQIFSAYQELTKKESEG